MSKLVMVAFGGNALLRAGQKGTFAEQMANVEEACRGLLPLVERGDFLVIGHGNGPQVGNALLRHEAGAAQFGLEAMPMDFCGAETQGSIAYMIETAMERVLLQARVSRPVVSLVTRVEVASGDPAFENPTKPVGPYYKECPSDGATYRFDEARGGWRKVVASPKPLAVSNIELVERLARQGYIVICTGGGGIPVVAGKDGRHGVEAVIDKDLACSLAAAKMHADQFLIMTDVPKVCINFHKPGEKALDRLTLAQARGYLAAGEFAEGSMAPKIRAAISFLESGGKECIISETSITL